MSIKKFSNILLINFSIFLIFLIFIELILRIKFNSNIDISKPFNSVKSLILATVNINSKIQEDFNLSKLQKFPFPYVMFKGFPNKLDHNYLGYKISDPINKSTINIAFFGGSTGYNGEPNLVELITNNLNESNTNVKYAPLNFSVVSSNHNQHLHSLLENYNKYPLDIVIFYGGYNETLQTAFYDSRPGYPYNFDKKNEYSPEKMLFFKHFAFSKVLEKMFPNDYKKKVWTKKWSNEIVNNYSITIEKTRKLSRIFTTGRCKKTFVFIYQPFNLNEELGVKKNFIQNVHIPISQIATISKDGIDLSNIFQNDKSFYTDIVHINQKGKELIASSIINSNEFTEVISSCSL